MTIKQGQSCQIPQLRALWKEAFGDTDDFLDGFFQVGFSQDRCRCLWEGDQLGGALYWFDCTWQDKKVAYIYGVATNMAFRGQGVCRRLMEDTHRLLKEQGYRGSLLVPGNEGLFQLYEKMGYRPCCGKKAETVLAGTDPVALTQISPAAYEELQKHYLPEARVVHSAAALDFAGTYNRFYQGEDFAFCGGAEDQIFYFQEFLGKTQKLPGILSALQARCGQLRVAGDIPFAMYLPLDGTEALPQDFDIPLN